MALFKRSTQKTAKANAAPQPAESGPATVVAEVILADIAMRAAETVLRRGVDRALPGSVAGAKGGAKIGGGIGRGIGGGIAARVIKFAALRIATRSVPGAIAVGGALVAKSLYDRRRARAAKAPKK